MAITKGAERKLSVRPCTLYYIFYNLLLYRYIVFICVSVYLDISFYTYLTRTLLVT